MKVMRATELLKAKYIKRWKGPKGKWQYEYPGKGTPKKKTSLPEVGSLKVHDSRGPVKSSLPQGQATVKKGTEYQKHGDLKRTSYNVSGGPIYRGVSLEDYKRIKEQGYVDTDMRGAISENEGMNLTHHPETAIEYIPSGKKGVVLAIDPEGVDFWGVASDDYIRTSERIPVAAIKGVSDVMDKQAEADKFEVHSIARRGAFYLGGAEMLEEAGYPEKAKEWRSRAEREIKEELSDPRLQKKAIEIARTDKKMRDEYKEYIDLDEIIKKSVRDRRGVMQVYKPSEMLKAKYSKRWRGKDGKWHYSYDRDTTTSSKETVKVRNQFGKVEEVEVDSDDPILQQMAEKKKATANAKKKAAATLDKKGIKTVKDIDRLRGGSSRYQYLSSLVGKDMANVVLRSLEVQSWKGPKKK